MKKIILIAALIINANFASAQWTTASTTGDYWLPTGNAGIGISAPTTKLHVFVENNGLNIIAGLQNHTGNSSGGNAVGIGFLNEVAGSYWKAAIVHERTGGFGVGSLKFLVSSTVDASMVSLADTKMTILPSGNVGIGTTRPQRNLDLSTTGQLTFGDNPVTNSNSGMYWSSGDRYGIYRTAGEWQGSALQQLRIQFDSGIQLGAGTGNSTTEHDKSYVEVVNGKGLMVSSGGLGIGTTAPSTKLHVSVNNNGLNIVTGLQNQNITSNGGNAVGIGFINEGAGATYWKASIVHERTNAYGVGSLKFLVSSATDQSTVTLADTKMTILPSGNIGVGTTAPDQKLTVNGTIHSKEVKVDLSVPAPDYVFNTGYNLINLNELKTM